MRRVPWVSLQNFCNQWRDECWDTTKFIFGILYDRMFRYILNTRVEDTMGGTRTYKYRVGERRE